MRIPLPTFLSALAALALVPATAIGGEMTFTQVAPPAGYTDLYLEKVSDDGENAVGLAYRPSGIDLYTGFHAVFRWTRSGGLQRLVELPLGYIIRDVTPDGLAATGHGTGIGGEAFRWTEATGLQLLGKFQGNRTEGRGISADGSTVVGLVSVPGVYPSAIRWTQTTGITKLGSPPGFAIAFDVSADGSFICGEAASMPVWWDASGAMTSLGTLGGGGTAHPISGDGQNVFGISLELQGEDYVERVFRWTPATGIKSLGPTPVSDLQNAQNASSFHGTRMVGRTYDPETDNLNGYVWDETDGMRPISALLAGQSAQVRALPLLPSGISDNGSVLAGGIANGSGAAWILSGLEPETPPTDIKIAIVSFHYQPTSTPPGTVRFSLSATTGRNYGIDRSADLGHIDPWTRIHSGTVPSESFQVDLPEQPLPACYYRATSE